jgi:hypothetical protein
LSTYTQRTGWTSGEDIFAAGADTTGSAAAADGTPISIPAEPANPAINKTANACFSIRSFLFYAHSQPRNQTTTWANLNAALTEAWRLYEKTDRTLPAFADGSGEI